MNLETSYKSFKLKNFSEDTSNSQWYTFTGYLSTFNNVDLHGDVVLPGAFTESILQMEALGSLISTIFNTNLATRLINHYTAHGIIIVVMQLANMGVLPAGVTEAIDGLDTKDTRSRYTLMPKIVPVCTTLLFIAMLYLPKVFASFCGF